MTCTSSDGTTVAESYCTGSRPVVAGTVPDFSACTYDWSISKWSDWSSTCSPAATRTRTVECRRSDGELAARQTMCGSDLPASTEKQAIYTDCGGVLVNADFEAGTMKGWSGGTISTVRKSGSYAASIGAARAVLSQTVQTQPISYSLTFHCYAFGGYAVFAYWNGTQVASCNGAGGGNSAWSVTPVTGTVKGTGGRDVLSFSSTTSGRLVDDVVLSPKL